LKETLNLNVTSDSPISTIKELLVRYKESKEQELEEERSHASTYKDSLNAEKEAHFASMERIKLLSSEIKILKEEVRANKDNDTAQEGINSQLLAFQIQHKRDVEANKKLMEKLAKVKTEYEHSKKKDEEIIKELNENLQKSTNTKKKLVDNWMTSSDSEDLKSQAQTLELMQSENEALKISNVKLTEQYKILKEDMDETVEQLLVRILYKRVEQNKRNGNRKGA
jgi:hypothetical protein